MKTSLIPSMLSVVVKNIPLTNQISFFEIAHTYHKRNDDLPKEEPTLLLTTTRGFLEMKGIVEALLEDAGITDIQIENNTSHFYHPKQSGTMQSKNTHIANFGTLHPLIAQQFGIEKPLFLAEMTLSSYKQLMQPNHKYTPIPQYPAIKEDITLDIQKEVAVGSVLETIRGFDPLIYSVTMSSVYKSFYTFSLAYLDRTKNITQETVDKIRTQLLAELQSRYKTTVKK